MGGYGRGMYGGYGGYGMGGMGMYSNQYNTQYNGGMYNYGRNAMQRNTMRYGGYGRY